MEAICFRIESLLGNYETALYGSIFPGNINRDGLMRTDVYCISIIDYWWNYRTCNVAFLKGSESHPFSWVCSLPSNFLQGTILIPTGLEVVDRTDDFINCYCAANCFCDISITSFSKERDKNIEKRCLDGKFD